MQPELPRISIVIEAYNEAHAALAFHLETMDALLAQSYPRLDQVEVILIGSRKHVEVWTGAPDPAWRVFHSIRGVVVEESDGGHY